MMIETQWDAALDELHARQIRHRAIRPYCAALIPVVQNLRSHPRAGSVLVQVSHATVIIALPECKRRVGLGWRPDGHYEVFLVEPGLEFVDLRSVTADDVVEAVIGYLDRVRG